VLRGHDGIIMGLALSSDGRWLVTGSQDKTARIWDLESADPAVGASVLRGHDEGILCLALSPDCRWLVTGSVDNTVRAWILDPQDLCDLAGAYAGRSPTAEERRQFAIPETPALIGLETKRPPLPPFLVNLPRVIPSGIAPGNGN
jgi:hypothetical protein